MPKGYRSPYRIIGDGETRKVDCPILLLFQYPHRYFHGMNQWHAQHIHVKVRSRFHIISCKCEMVYTPECSVKTDTGGVQVAHSIHRKPPKNYIFYLTKFHSATKTDKALEPKFLKAFIRGNRLQGIYYGLLRHWAIRPAGRRPPTFKGTRLLCR